MSILKSPEEFKQAICTIRASICGESREFHVQEDLNINYDQLELEMDNFPQIYHLWSMVYSEVKEQLDQIETQIKKRRSALTKIVLDANNKMRKTDINDIVECDNPLLVLEAQKIILEKKSMLCMTNPARSQRPLPPTK